MDYFPNFTPMNQYVKFFLFALSFVVVGLWIGIKIQGGRKWNFSRMGERKGLISSPAQKMKKLQDVFELIDRNYVKDVDQEALVESAIQGVMEELDPHTFYIPAVERKVIGEQMEGSFEGIGVEFDILEDTVYIEAPIPGTPSDKLGIKSGDRIIKVDGENIAGIGINNEKVIKTLKGPRGSKVVVSILRRGVSELLDFEITRDQIPLNSIRFAYMVDDHTGYVKVDRFAETTYKEFKMHLETLIEEGMQNLVLDLRGNPGGYMTVAYQMADELLENGKLIVSTKGRIPESRQEYFATDDLALFEQGPVIVLQDYNSASASEIVAGALQDHDRGLIIGIRSFGKGLVQIQEDLDDGSAIRLVISEYYTPSGRCIQKPYTEGSSAYEHEIVERFQSGEVFDASKVEFPDSLMYATGSGRTVYGGGGIFPDIFVPNDTSQESTYLFRLRSKDIFRDFAAYYVENHSALGLLYDEPRAFIEEFELTQDVVKNFIDFAEEHGVPFDPEGYELSEIPVQTTLKAYIGRRLHNDAGFFPILHEMDHVFQEALRMIPTAAELERSGSMEFMANE